ncbi:MAG TPA: L,D-transpeptidase family protein [Chthoniobacterales bacterium]|nr:L,D-transpeptidase family protein [Chthoniobacterales bacterium]
MLTLSAGTAHAAANPLRRSRQCIVVVSSNWNSTTGVLRAFERADAGGAWRARGAEVPVVLGKKGLGWGRGVVNADPEPKPRKIEGDNKAPAGVFHLGTAFGYAPAESAASMKLPYLPLTKNIEGVDDPRSRYYNQLVDCTKVPRVDWRSSEKMRRDDHLYKWGLVVDHNPTAIPGAGSLIFFHIWKNSSSPTAGCTAMPEKDLVKLIRWLDPAARPILVQMPRDHYAVFRSKFGLPVMR